MDFSGAIVKGSLPNALNNQGFVVTCSGCPQYVNFRFDANKTVNESTYISNYDASTSSLPSFWQARQYVIGVKDVNNMSQLAKTIFEGVRAATDKPSATYLDADTSENVLVDSNHELRIAKDPNNPNRYLFLKEEANGLELQFTNKLIEANPPQPEPDPVDIVPTDYINEGGPLWIHHGTGANQRVNVYINSMKTSALGCYIFDSDSQLMFEKDRQAYEDLSTDPKKQAEFMTLLDVRLVQQ